MYSSANHGRTIPEQTNDDTTLRWWEALAAYNDDVRGSLLCPEAPGAARRVEAAFGHRPVRLAEADVRDPEAAADAARRLGRELWVQRLGLRPGQPRRDAAALHPLPAEGVRPRPAAGRLL
jgi:hypothetical protein